MPDKCWSVLSAERSAASIARALPSRRISTVPTWALAPSSINCSILTFPSIARKNPAAISSPATMISWRAFISAVNRASSAIVAFEVTSPPWPRSSPSVRRMKSMRSKVAGSGMTPRLVGGLSSLKDAPAAVLILIGLRLGRPERRAVPAVNGDRHLRIGDIDRVEALLLLANAGRGRRARLDDEHASGTRDEIARVLARRVMRVPREQDVDPRFLDRVERQLLPPDRPLDLLAHGEREKRMVGDED